jgi:hypothetical protein
LDWVWLAEAWPSIAGTVVNAHPMVKTPASNFIPLNRFAPFAAAVPTNTVRSSRNLNLTLASAERPALASKINLAGTAWDAGTCLFGASNFKGYTTKKH